MARINVEQKALTDPRFHALAKLRELADRFHALGMMIQVWNECIERGTYTLPCYVVEAIFQHSSAPADLVTCELAEWASENTLRIRGTEGRTDYLSRLRAGNRERQRRKRERDSEKKRDVTRDNRDNVTPSRGAPAPAPAPDRGIPPTPLAAQSPADPAPTPHSRTHKTGPDRSRIMPLQRDYVRKGYEPREAYRLACADLGIEPAP